MCIHSVLSAITEQMVKVLFTSSLKWVEPWAIKALYHLSAVKIGMVNSIVKLVFLEIFEYTPINMDERHW